MAVVSLTKAPAEPLEEPLGEIAPSALGLLGLHTRGGWSLVLAALLLALVVVPVLNLLPAESVLHLPDYLIPLLGKFMCCALVALAVDLIWGYAGILSLGHGVFFALGGHAMGMHPDAGHRHRGRLSQRAARLHGLSGLEGVAVVLVWVQ